METQLNFGFFAGRRLHMGVCGSIAAFKALELLRAFHSLGLRVSVTLTPAAQKFVTALSFSSLGAEQVYTAMFPDSSPGDGPFGHLAPGAEAEAFLIAPASATTLARLSGGLADEMLAAQALAFTGPLLLAPAMNPRMWANPATRANCARLKERGHRLVDPECGLVACNETGQGRLPDLREIFFAALAALAPQDLAGQTVLVTLGPTKERWDGVRYWTNPSTGLMGACLAVAAALRGARVEAVCGPGCPWLPAAVVRHNVESAGQMFEKADSLWDCCDIGVFTAAVADFSPEPHGAAKFKKSEAKDGFSVRFLPNRDILAHLGGRKKPGQRVIGFAAESSDLENQVRQKLRGKNADLLVGNLINQPGSGFAGKTNQAFVAASDGREEAWPLLSKPDLAWRIWECLLHP